MSEITVLENKIDIQETAKKNRIWEIDFLRGFCIVLMVIDHMMWNIHDFIWRWFDIGTWTNNYPNQAGLFIPQFLVNYHNFGTFYYTNEFRIATRLVILFVFFFVSGVSCTFSKNNIKRGLMCLGAGLIVTTVTVILSIVDVINPQTSIILFGVLSCYGVSILICEGLKRLSKKIFKDNYNGWLISAFIIILLCFLFGIYFENQFRSYRFNLKDPLNVINAIFGSIIGYTPFGGDFFPLFPYLGYMLIGILFGETFYKDKKSLFKKEEPKILKPFSIIGKHTIWVYLLHIPVITIFHAILFWASGFHLNF